MSSFSIWYTYQSKHELIVGSTITSTASSDTLETLRTNVNNSLTSLQNDKVSTTTAYTWTALQSLFASASTTGLSANYATFGGTASTTFTLAGSVGLASTSPFGSLTVEQGTESASLWVANTGSTTPSLVVRGVNGNGNVGVASSSPTAQLSIGGGNATSTIAGGYFCGYFKDEAGRGMWIKLATSGNTAFSTSTTACNTKQ